MSNRTGLRLTVAAVVVVLIAGCSPSADELRDKGDVQGLVTMLGSDASADARSRAAAALGVLGAAQGPTSTAAAEALDHLGIALASDSEVNVRVAAADGLAGLKLDAAVMPLLLAIGDSAEPVRTVAVASLVELIPTIDRQAVVAVLVDALDHEDSAVRAHAATQLGAVGDTAALAPLLGALGDPADAVGGAASAALDSILKPLGPSNATAALVVALGDPSDPVRAAAATRLGMAGSSEAFVPLFRALDDPVGAVRISIGDAVKALLAQLSDAAVAELYGIVTDGDRDLLAPAEGALRDLLANLGPKRAIAALMAAGADDPWLAVALDVPVRLVAFETRRLSIELEPASAIRDAAGRARSGKPVAGSHSYSASGAFHPAIVFSESGLPGATEWWAPTAKRFLELVVVETSSRRRIEVCHYYGPDITRYRTVSTIRVYSALTGKVVAQRTYSGPAPRQCRRTEPYSLTVLQGGPPSLTRAVRWLDSLINPPSP